MLYKIIGALVFPAFFCYRNKFIAERGYEALQRSVYWIRKVDFLMSKHKPFRSVFYYQNKNTKWRYIVKVVFPPLQTVEIGEIIFFWGGGGIHPALYSSDIPLQGR